VTADTTIDRRSDMGKIVIFQNITLDGVVQDPSGDEGITHGGWFLGAGDKESRYLAWTEVIFSDAKAAEAILLGRRSDEWLASRWSSRTDEVGDRLNSMPKYVVSSTLQQPKWANATVLKGNVVDEITKLKQELDGEILVYASAQLVRTLIGNDLADELRLMIHPIVVGAGERLFGGTSDKVPLRQVAIRTVGDDLAYVTYQVDRAASS
jgi:dihydrofolate reductase